MRRTERESPCDPTGHVLANVFFECPNPLLTCPAKPAVRVRGKIGSSLRASTFVEELRYYQDTHNLLNHELKWGPLNVYIYDINILYELSTSLNSEPYMLRQVAEILLMH